MADSRILSQVASSSSTGRTYFILITIPNWTRRVSSHAQGGQLHHSFSGPCGGLHGFTPAITSTIVPIPCIHVDKPPQHHLSTTSAPPQRRHLQQQVSLPGPTNRPSSLMYPFRVTLFSPLS
eukprot:4132938-Pyramimonas_sp.AAC.1